MRKIILFFILVCLAGSAFSTGMPVVDFGAIAQAVNSFVQSADQWKMQMKQWEQEYQRAKKAAEAIASGDYMAVVDGITQMSGILANYRTSPYSLDDSWLATVEENVNKIGSVGYSYAMPIKNILKDNVTLQHSTAKIKSTITGAIKKYQKAAEGKMITCSTCGGTGQVKGYCEQCKGSGYNSIVDSWQSTKEYEFGKFLEKCKTCSGSGFVWRKCNLCNGTGKVKAPETYRKITVDSIINLFDAGENFLSQIANLSEDLANLQISASEYRQILEAVRDDYLRKYGFANITAIALKIEDNRREIAMEQRAQENALIREQQVQAEQHKLTAKKLEDQTTELIELYRQLNKLQSLIEELADAEAKEAKLNLYNKIKSDVRQEQKKYDEKIKNLVHQPNLIPAGHFLESMPADIFNNF